MAHIERRRRRGQSVWRARYRGSDGREHSRSFDRRVNAEAFLTKVAHSKLRGEWHDPALGRTTFAEWTDQVERSRVNRRTSTRARDATLLRTRVLPTFGTQQVARISTTDVKAWVAELEAVGLAPATIRKCYQLLARVLDEAAEAGLIAASPCRRVQLPPDLRSEPALLTPEHVSAIAETIDRRHRALVLTAAYTGLRWGELTGLRVQRIDFLRRRIDVAQILIEVDGELSFGPPKTRTSRAQVSFPPFLADELAAHVAAFPDQEPQRGLVFTSDDGAPLRRSNFRRRVWIPAVGAAGAPPAARFHDLRHACASWLIHAGANPLEVAAKLRHARVTTTLATYGHLFPGTDERLDVLLAETYESAAAPDSLGSWPAEPRTSIP
ncbi:MAG: tyrosine-type recombinase/integrase [Microthrixaceae bacterium]